MRVQRRNTPGSHRSHTSASISDGGADGCESIEFTYKPNISAENTQVSLKSSIRLVFTTHFDPLMVTRRLSVFSCC